jgi:hypothetical protein
MPLMEMSTSPSESTNTVPSAMMPMNDDCRMTCIRFVRVRKLSARMLNTVTTTPKPRMSPSTFTFFSTE